MEIAISTIPRERACSFRVREGRFWHQRGAQPTSGGEVLLHLYHVDPEPVDVVARGIGAEDPAVRPGPGAAGSVVLEAPTDYSVTVHLLEVGPLLKSPSVVMPVPFHAVRLDGRPWSYHHGRRVFLPRRPGVYRIELQHVRRVIVGPSPTEG